METKPEAENSGERSGAPGAPEADPAGEENFCALDWNFDEVPDDELRACRVWEYGRESAFVRGVKGRCEDRKARNMTNIEFQGFAGDDISAIQGMGYESDVLLRGVFLRKEPEGKSGGNGRRRPITGSFPCPWQSLSEAERKERSSIGSDREIIPLKPFERGEAGFASSLAEFCKARRAEAPRARKRSGAPQDPMPPGENQPESGPTSEEIRPSLFWAAGEVGVFQIAWAHFTNEELREGFYEWARAHRPKDLPGPDGRGHKVLSDRVGLERLGILRLTLGELRAESPLGWKRYHAPNRRWRRDVQRACAHFRGLFPFLPAGQMPLSWPPKGAPEPAG